MTCARDLTAMTKRMALCTNCCRTFNSVAAFDAHQNDSGERIVCYSPDARRSNGKPRYYMHEGIGYRDPHVGVRQRGLPPDPPSVQGRVPPEGPRP